MSLYKSTYRNPNVGRASIYLRYRYKLPIHQIARIVGVSTRTVWRKLAFERLIRQKFDLRRRGHHRFRFQVKIVNRKGLVVNLKSLILRAFLFVLGYLQYPEQITCDEPP